jgi:hypothetical protein
LNEYNRLLDRANRPETGPAVPPVPAVLTGAELRVRVDRDAVRGVFNLTGDVLRTGINRVHLLTGATLVDGAMAGRPLPLVTDGPNHWALLLGPGPFGVTLEWGGSLAFTPGRASFTLPVPPAGAARAVFDVPGEQADVRLSPGLVTRRSSAGGRTQVEATLDPGSSTTVSWSMRDSAPVAASREVRTIADVFTLVTIGESDLRMVALADLTVVQGEPATTAVRLPAGYELTTLTGNSFETYTERDGLVTLTLSNPAARRHQFLLGLERPHEGGSFALTTGLVTLPGVQREQGEIALEGVGTLELAVAEREALHRIDVREINPSLQSLARQSLLSAFRYQTTAGAEPPAVALDVKRFGNAGVIAAVADRATATTLVTSEGRALTEIVLHIQNRAQPFLKVALPTGASMVSVEVAGQSAKPALGTDGTRVPLLRPGFKPQGPYAVSFVYLHDGTPFARKGNVQMALPTMDIPVSLVEWEVFVPERYEAKPIGGNVIARTAYASLAGESPIYTSRSSVVVSTSAQTSLDGPVNAGAGTIAGSVRDTSGGVMPGVTVQVTSASLVEKSRSSVTDSTGRFQITALPPGVYSLTMSLTGFVSVRRENVLVSGGATTSASATMQVGQVGETVTVVAEAPVVDVQNARQQMTLGESETGGAPVRRVPKQQVQAPSQNVINLQQRASGVLPVRVDVPRSGISHQFVRALVVDEQTTVDLRYKRK